VFWLNLQANYDIELVSLKQPVVHGVDCDSTIREAIDYRKSGGEFLTFEQSLTNGVS
jgi:plasmid maintenance system antidote protein VapI